MAMRTMVSSLLGRLKALPSVSCSWTKTLLLVILAANIKNLPFVWHLRFLRSLTTGAFIPRSHPSSALSPTHIFLPAITSTRSPLLECDYNIHKSNSTYFSDLDISRGNLIFLLFRSQLSIRNGPSKPKLIPILGGVQCSFKREILPYQGYEIWTRVLSWDEKWIYLVSHFVEKGRVRPEGYMFQGGSGKGKKGKGNGKMEEKYVLASSIARYVFKNGRKTIPPSKPLVDCNLLPLPPLSDREHDNVSGEEALGDGEAWEKIEAQRKAHLDIAQLRGGWDAVHGLFSSDEESLALGRYADLLWR